MAGNCRMLRALRTAANCPATTLVFYRSMSQAHTTRSCRFARSWRCSLHRRTWSTWILILSYFPRPQWRRRVPLTTLTLSFRVIHKNQCPIIKDVSLKKMLVKFEDVWLYAETPACGSSPDHHSPVIQRYFPADFLSASQNLSDDLPNAVLFHVSQPTIVTSHLP